MSATLNCDTATNLSNFDKSIAFHIYSHISLLSLEIIENIYFYTALW